MGCTDLGTYPAPHPPRAPQTWSPAAQPGPERHRGAPPVDNPVGGTAGPLLPLPLPGVWDPLSRCGVGRVGGAGGGGTPRSRRLRWRHRRLIYLLFIAIPLDNLIFFLLFYFFCLNKSYQKKKKTQTPPHDGWSFLQGVFWVSFCWVFCGFFVGFGVCCRRPSQRCRIRQAAVGPRGAS